MDHQTELVHFQMRIQNLELRSCDEHLMSVKPHSTMEILQWDLRNEKEFCWTIAFWKRGKEGYDLLFVGNRPFEKRVSPTDFMELAERGQNRLDSRFWKQKANEE